MNYEEFIIWVGLILLGVSGALVLTEPSEIVTEPEPRSNVEVYSYVNGSAVFKYHPVQNGSYTVKTSYEKYIDGNVVEEVNNMSMEVSQKSPVKIYINASPNQTVSVAMRIWSTENRLIHSSRHVIGPEEN